MVFKLYRDLLELKRLIILADAVIIVVQTRFLLFTALWLGCFQILSLFKLLILHHQLLLASLG